MTPLAALIAERIGGEGPMTLADYMSLCLLHPEHGYYTTRAPFGTAGDFITAPEISQMFGELMGIALAQAWLDQGSPDCTLAELGPGRGTLMADALRATRRVPGFHAAARVVLMEASPPLRARQRAALGDHPATWIDRTDDLPEAPLFLIANEFFDALPIRQFRRDAEGWRETLVRVEGGRLTLGLAAPRPEPALQHRLADTQPGEVAEICAAATPIMATIAARIARHGGAALIIDYGGWRSRGNTFQALRVHAPVDPLAEPGLADLTAHVDFEALAQAACPLAHAFVPQGAVLQALGIGPRAARLAEGMEGAGLKAHLAATRRLTAPDEMGTLFKVLALHPAQTPAPPGMT